MKHTWMTSNDINDIDILETVRENFNPRRTLKSAVGAIRAMNRLKTATDKKGELNAASAFSKALENTKLKKQKEQQQQAGVIIVPTEQKAEQPAAVAVAAI